ncbi:MAG: hypothetical protein ABSH08_19605 [Tepidisphaeraceae bacterium]|jgi:hypothetical protein
MIGNTLGWKISAVIFLLAVVVGTWLHNQMQITAPTSLSLDEKNLAPLSPPAPAQPIVDQNQPQDAGEKYSAAIAAYDENEDACDEFAKKPVGPPPPPIQLVMDATNLSQMNLFAKNPQTIVDYQSNHPALDKLSKLGQDLQSAALLCRKDHPDQAMNLLRAAYALGANLYRERVDYDEFSQGMGLMNGAITAMAEMEPADSSRQKLLQTQQQQVLDFYETHVKPIYDDVISKADQQSIAEHAGDIFRFAAKSKEKMFRVEAILKLGRYRFDAARAADQLAAPRFLRRFQRDPDPAIQAAAQAAANLTIEQYRMIH